MLIYHLMTNDILQFKLDSLVEGDLTDFHD